MPFFLIFLWDGENEDHLAEHGITTGEFEFVVLTARQADVQQSRSSSRQVAIGETPDGRRIACVYEEIDDVTCYPITAYEV